MKVGDLVRFKNSIREDVGIITKFLSSPMDDSIFGRRVLVMTMTGPRQYTEKHLEVLSESR